MRTPYVLTAAVAAALVLTACGSEKSGADPGAGGVQLTGVRWSVESLSSAGKRQAAPAGGQAYLQITKDSAEGDNGCGPFRARAETGAKTLTLTDPTVNDLGCDAPRTAFADAFMKVIEGPVTTAVSGDRLTLTAKSGDTLVLTTRPEAPPAPLAGTKWTVTGLGSGQSAASLPAGTEGTAYFTIGTDGRAEGNLGCNSFHATAKVAGSAVTFGPVAATKMACTGPAGEVERSVSAVLTGTARARIEGTALTLEGPGGKTLTATAG
ncbi:META domain-containing protein [Streptomyces sp. NPDC089919]|uniref:META domain-containing protein n=1 Tax=Streptomyces sp. NPDC089919 TaxID=3155188 RepID=UPI00342BDD78